VDLGVLLYFSSRANRSASLMVGADCPDGVEAQLMGGLLFGSDVAHGTRIFTYQNGDQTRGNIVFGLEFVNFFFLTLPESGRRLPPLINLADI